MADVTQAGWLRMPVKPAHMTALAPTGPHMTPPDPTSAIGPAPIRIIDLVAAFATGGLLTLMIHFNGELWRVIRTGRSASAARAPLRSN